MSLLVEKEKAAEGGVHIDVQARLAGLNTPIDSHEHRSMNGNDVYLTPTSMGV
jgi:hypothetical protein